MRKGAVGPPSSSPCPLQDPVTCVGAPLHIGAHAASVPTPHTSRAITRAQRDEYAALVAVAAPHNPLEHPPPAAPVRAVGPAPLHRRRHPRLEVADAVPLTARPDLCAGSERARSGAGAAAADEAAEVPPPREARACRAAAPAAVKPAHLDGHAASGVRIHGRRETVTEAGYRPAHACRGGAAHAGPCQGRTEQLNNRGYFHLLLVSVSFPCPARTRGRTALRKLCAMAAVCRAAPNRRAGAARLEAASA